MSSPDFWSDNDKAQSVINKVNCLKEIVETYNNINNQCQEFEELLQLLELEEDPQMLKEMECSVSKLYNQLEKLEMTQLLSGEYDSNDAIVALNSGAGGLEAQDWVEMLYRMYIRWCEKQGFNVDTWDYLPDEEGGIKSVTLSIKAKMLMGC